MYFDSAAASEDMAVTTSTPKAIKHAGVGLVGIAGSWRVINLISALSRRKVTPKMILETLKAVKGEDESIKDMEIICAWPNRPLVIIQSDLSVIELESSFMAIGSGSAYSIGYLEACKKITEKELHDAVRVAAKYTPEVMEPVKNLYCA
jgi:ATP-dependent protease HslVU (ClpYQ) peptidase subunit